MIKLILFTAAMIIFQEKSPEPPELYHYDIPQSWTRQFENFC